MDRGTTLLAYNSCLATRWQLEDEDGVGVSVGGYTVPHNGCSVIDMRSPPVATPGSQDIVKKETEATVITGVWTNYRHFSNLHLISSRVMKHTVT
jgi:hypothetical protein